MEEEVNEKYIDFFKDFYQYIEPDCFDNFKILLDRIVQTESLEYDDTKARELVDELRSNQGVDFNLIINECCDFFTSINPLYGEMARNILRDPKQIKFHCSMNPRELFIGSNTDIELHNNWNDVCILSHELTHSFVNSTDMKVVHDNHSFTYIFQEVPAIVIEYLTKDYILEKRGVDVKALEKSRIANIEITQKMLSDTNSNSELHHDVIDFLDYDHTLGILIANYIYLKIKENPRNIEMLDAMLTIIAKGKAYPEECIQLLEKVGIPIVCNGKISLNEENMEKLYESYFEKFKDYYSSSKSK